MASMKLTAEAIAGLALPDGKNEKFFWDEDMPGFGLRLRAGGKRVWVVQHHANKKTRRITLGPITLIPPGMARIEAKKLLAAMCLGQTPVKKGGHSTLEQRITDKAMRFLEQNLEPACYLYRHYHPSGDLLYVGISLEPLRRQKTHTKTARWRNMICRIVIEPFATREAALTAEQYAIRTEFPKFNATHNGQRHPIQELARRIAPQTEQGAAA